MPVNRAQLRRRRERAESLLPPPPELGKEAPPPWFARWAEVFTAQIYTAGGIPRETARMHPQEVILPCMSFNFRNARYSFIRNLNREPTLDEKQRWFEAAEATAPRDTRDSRPSRCLHPAPSSPPVGSRRN